jgi:ATP-dependent helicase/nuclease subunit A
MEHAGGAVRVMTVHGAKGLEAPIVIVPDTTQIPQQEQRAGLLYTDDCVFFSVQKAIEVAAIAAAKTALHDREMEEYRRLLYVALTRARDWLILAGYEMKKPPVHPESWYPMLENAAGEMGATPDEDGVFALGDDVGTGASDGRAAEAAEALPAFLRAPAPKEPVIPRILRPSDAAGEEEPALISPLTDNGKRFRRGLLMHALLAALPNAPEHTRPQAAENYLAREGVAPDDAAEIAAEALAILAHPDFAALFAEGSRAEVPIVAAMPELGVGIRVSGQIDRLAVTADSVLIADYKTNRPPPKTPEDTPTLYRAQMALYRAALQKIYPKKRVSCALVWTDGARLMPLSDAMLDAELVKITQRLVGFPAT